MTTTGKAVIKAPLLPSSTSDGALILGKQPPHVIELEEAVLGALMLDKSVIPEVRTILSTKMFYTDQHKAIYEAIQDLYDLGHPVDILTVTQRLRNNGDMRMFPSGPYYLTQLTNRVASAANIEYHSRIIMQMYILRQLIKGAMIIQEEAHFPTVDSLDLLDKHYKIWQDLNTEITLQKEINVINETQKIINEIENNTGGLYQPGIPYRWGKINDITGGKGKGDLITVAAKSGEGKTSFVLDDIRHTVFDLNIPVLFFTLEMKASALIVKILSMESGVNSRKIHDRKLNTVELEKVKSVMARMNNKLIIDDSVSTIEDVRMKSAKYIARNGVQHIAIDYLQLLERSNMLPKGASTTDIISHNSRGLKKIGMMYDIAVTQISQLSRAEKGSKGRKPQLYDLKGSGSIEQDSTTVLMPFRPDYMNDDTTIEDSSGNSLRGKAIIYARKNRIDAPGHVVLDFHDETQTFTERDDFNDPLSEADMSEDNDDDTF